MITVGIDVGSITTKAAVIKDEQLKTVEVQPTGYDSKRAADLVFETVLDRLQLSQVDIGSIVATGYGRKSVSFGHKAVTEITCHAKGAHFIDPTVRSVIDIGGQDSKVIRLNDNGKVLDFAMNDKCAAGTGRFLEVMARALEIDLIRFGRMSLHSTPERLTSSIHSEVISLISKGEERENIVAGIHDAIAARVVSMAKRVKIEAPVMMTGGVAKNEGLVRALEVRLEQEIRIDETAQTIGAIGAAIL